MCWYLWECKIEKEKFYTQHGREESLRSEYLRQKQKSVVECDWYIQISSCVGFNISLSYRRNNVKMKTISRSPIYVLKYKNIIE